MNIDYTPPEVIYRFDAVEHLVERRLFFHAKIIADGFLIVMEQKERELLMKELEGWNLVLCYHHTYGLIAVISRQIKKAIEEIDKAKNEQLEAVRPQIKRKRSGSCSIF